MDTPDVSRYKRTERRIARFTLIIGGAAALLAAYVSSLHMGAGILAGAVLAWISFRWLESALDGLVPASVAGADAAQTHVPLGSIFKIIARYALIAGAVCVIFLVFQVPVLSMLLGLCALGAATIVATLCELWYPAN